VTPTPTPVPVAVTPTPTPVPVAVTPTPTPVPVAVVQPTPVQPKGTGTGTRPKQGTGGTTTTVARVEKEPVAAPEPKPKKGGEDDDFASAFGSDVKKAPKEDTTTSKPDKKPAGYIPPAPGGSAADVKNSLEQGDIMEVVLANKGALGKCVEEQRKKDPGTSGKLLMKWTIQTSGKTSNVGVVSEEFKGTPIAGCVGALIKGMQFPRHKVQGEPITFPFKF